MNTSQDKHDHPSRASREEASTPAKRQERAIDDGHAMDHHDNPAARLVPRRRPATKFRPEERKLVPDQLKLRDEITDAFEDLDALLQKMPGNSGTRGRAAMALEESHMWAMKDFI
jgi:hypothetical protein